MKLFIKANKKICPNKTDEKKKGKTDEKDNVADADFEDVKKEDKEKSAQDKKRR